MQLLTSRCEDLRNDLATVQHRMAREKDDSRYNALAEEFDRIRSELAAAEKELKTLQSLRPASISTAPEQEVDQAMGLVAEIKRITSDPTARSEINPLLAKLGVRVGLTYGDAIKGKKRMVRRLLGGIMTFGKGQLPVKLHGPNWRGPAEPGNGRFDNSSDNCDNREKSSALDSSRQPGGKDGAGQSKVKACSRGVKEKVGRDAETPHPTLSGRERPARLGQNHQEAFRSQRVIGARGFEPPTS